MSPRRLPLLLLPWMVVMGGCTSPSEGEGEGEGDGPNLDPQVAFPSFTRTTRSELLRHDPNGDIALVRVQPQGEVVINGESYTSAQVSSPTGVSDVAGTLTSDSATLAQVVADSTLAESFGLPPHGEVRLEPPVQIDLSPPLGVEQIVRITGEAVVGSGTLPVPVDTTAGYTVTDDDVEVDTPMGTLVGCAAFTAHGVSHSFFGADTNLSGDGVFCPRFGVVAGNFDEPPSLAGLSLEAVGAADSKDLGGGYSSVYRTGVIGIEEMPLFQLSSYDAHQALDADKQTHAKMYVELRWADDVRAATDEPPSVTLSFQTVLGAFFHDEPTQSPVSFFFPEENGRGLNTWIVLVDQAAKNEEENGIAYSISAGGATEPVRVTGRIIYKVFTP